MSERSGMSAQRVHDLVMANRAIRSPEYQADRELVRRQRQAGLKGLQWGADIIPAMLGLFLVENDPRDDHPGGWIAFARHWRGETLRLDFDVKRGPEWPDETLVVTAVSGQEGSDAIVDDDVGRIALPEQVPTRQEWDQRARRYQSARRSDAGDDPAAVKAYVEALPGWKRAVATQVDEIIRREVPDVRRAVKWHAPFYGLDGQGWFVSFSALSNALRLTFMRGTSLEPVPPGGTREDARWIDLREGDPVDDTLVASWVRQAAAIPGWGG